MIIYLATDFTPYEGEEIIGAYSTFEAAGQAALSGKSETWHIARVYELELDTGKKDVFWQEEKMIMIRKQIETIIAQTTPLSGRARDNTFEALLKMAVKRGDKLFTIFAIDILSDRGKYPPELIEFAKNPIVYENKWVLPFSWVESTPIVESTQNRNWLKHLALARKGRENTQPVNQGWDHW